MLTRIPVFPYMARAPPAGTLVRKLITGGGTSFTLTAVVGADLSTNEHEGSFPLVCTHPQLAPVLRAGAFAFTLLPPRLAARPLPDEETHAPPLDRSPPAEGA